MAPSQRRFTSETLTSPSPAREGPVTRRRELETRGLCGCFNTYKVFHNLNFRILLSEQQRPADRDKPKEPRPMRGAAGCWGPTGHDRGAAGRPGARGDLSGLVPPSLGPVLICSFPRNSLSLAGAPRVADAPRSLRQGGFRRVNPWAGPGQAARARRRWGRGERGLMPPELVAASRSPLPTPKTREKQ